MKLIYTCYASWQLWLTGCVTILTICTGVDGVKAHLYELALWCGVLIYQLIYVFLKLHMGNMLGI